MVGVSRRGTLSNFFDACFELFPKIIHCFPTIIIIVIVILCCVVILGVVVLVVVVVVVVVVVIIDRNLLLRGKSGGLGGWGLRGTWGRGEGEGGRNGKGCWEQGGKGGEGAVIGPPNTTKRRIREGNGEWRKGVLNFPWNKQERGRFRDDKKKKKTKKPKKKKKRGNTWFLQSFFFGMIFGGAKKNCVWFCLCENTYVFSVFGFIGGIFGG